MKRIKSSELKGCSFDPLPNSLRNFIYTYISCNSFLFQWLRNQKKIIVTGGNGGIGQEIVQAILDKYPAVRIVATYNRRSALIQHERLDWQKIHLRDPSAIKHWSSNIDHLDWIINCVGLLHEEGRGPEKNIRAVDSGFLLENIRINTLPTLLLANTLQKR